VKLAERTPVRLQPRPREPSIASAGPSGQHVLGSQTCAPLQHLEDARRFQHGPGYGGWRISDAAFGRMSICVHSDATAFVIRSSVGRTDRVDDSPNSRKLPPVVRSIAASSHSCLSTLGGRCGLKNSGDSGGDLLHRSMTTSRIGCEQQTRILPSAGLSSGSGS